MPALVERLTPYLGSPYPSSGDEIRYDCPLCATRGKSADTKGHLYINSKKLLFFCQRCEAKGAAQRLFARFGVQVDGPDIRDWANIVQRMSLFVGDIYGEDYDPLEEAPYPCAVGTIWPGSTAENYLTKRGLSPDTIQRYRIQEGAYGTRWGERIFIPTLVNDVVTFWVARTLGHAEPKYLNPTDRSRRYHVFHLEQAKAFRSVIITEGVFSAIAAGPNAVATFGKFVTSEQLSQLAAADFSLYFVALDGDARPQSLYVAEWLRCRGKQVRVVDLPPDGDPASVGDFPQRLCAAQPFDFSGQVSFLFG